MPFGWQTYCHWCERLPRLDSTYAGALSADDITHYQRVVVAIKETIHLMAEIDKAIPQWPIP